jgi:lysophospholipase L1-like esterase
LLKVVSIIGLLAVSLLIKYPEMKSGNEKTMLCLGDSYTIGESVKEEERFPMQAVEMLKAKGVHISKPHIIATTGWTTDELADAIKEENLKGKFDYVTLLIGVNNQYRQRDTGEYRQQFRELLHTSIKYTGGNLNHVFVLSIPDWGVTPFVAKDGKQRTGKQIGEEIDEFNHINREEASIAKVHYIDITPISKEAINKHELIAEDGLHPSGLMYKEWAKLLAKKIFEVK